MDATRPRRPSLSQPNPGGRSLCKRPDSPCTSHPGSGWRPTARAVGRRAWGKGGGAPSGRRRPAADRPGEHTFPKVGAGLGAAAHSRCACLGLRCVDTAPRLTRLASATSQTLPTSSCRPWTTQNTHVVHEQSDRKRRRSEATTCKNCRRAGSETVRACIGMPRTRGLGEWPAAERPRARSGRPLQPIASSQGRCRWLQPLVPLDETGIRFLAANPCACTGGAGRGRRADRASGAGNAARRREAGPGWARRSRRRPPWEMRVLRPFMSDGPVATGGVRGR